ncbi:hypothetical protein EVAR_82824_1 [Eumeta japonica]|uniref:Uncharacterized protein n=1 Tax=Eumeta variegata TaxID=151549 RepID=A0A4C1V3Q6_EUMVA|nr:hypothetical protein EVAR_82824_1 [Eumeta japonica]
MKYHTRRIQTESSSFCRCLPSSECEFWWPTPFHRPLPLHHSLPSSSLTSLFITHFPQLLYFRLRQIIPTPFRYAVFTQEAGTALATLLGVLVSVNGLDHLFSGGSHNRLPHKILENETDELV